MRHFSGRGENRFLRVYHLFVHTSISLSCSSEIRLCTNYSHKKQTTSTTYYNIVNAQMNFPVPGKFLIHLLHFLSLLFHPIVISYSMHIYFTSTHMCNSYLPVAFLRLSKLSFCLSHLRYVPYAIFRLEKSSRARRSFS